MIAKLRIFGITVAMTRALALVFAGGKFSGCGAWVEFFTRTQHWRGRTECWVSWRSTPTYSLRSHALRDGNGFEPHRLVGLGDDDLARRHRLPVCVLGIERLGNDDDIAARLAVIERIGIIVGRITERIEVAAVRERRREAQGLPVILGRDHAGQRC